MAVPLPYWHYFSSPLSSNMKIGIKAVFKKDYGKFTASLLSRKEETTSDALLIAEMDGGKEMKLTNRVKGAIVNTKIIPDVDPLKGKDFQLFIEVEADQFRITVRSENSTVVTFPYAFSLESVRHLFINGDTDITVTLPDSE